MRYFLPKSNMNEQGLRKQFLFEVFHLWFVNNGSVDDFDVLQAFPFSDALDILIIYGHNYKIHQLLTNYTDLIHEKNIFIISCSPLKKHTYCMKGKRVYLSPQTEEQVWLLSGKEYEFDFDITDVELNLYNSKEKSAIAKLTSVFNLLNS